VIGSTVRRIRLAGNLARTLGPGWIAYRAKHAAQLRAGVIERRMPATSWGEVSLVTELSDPSLAEPDAYLTYRREQAPPFFFSTKDRETFAPLLCAWDTPDASPIGAADDVKRGVFRYFSRASHELGESPAWHRNAITGQAPAADRHWSRLDDFSSGDIKVIWEPNRFAFSYDLARAYWRTGDDEYPERFWRLVESWRDGNQPLCGPNWKCGQETSFRVMAWCFGLYAFLDAPAATPGRVAMLAEMVALSGHRIEGMVEYALSQQNNHGVSEGMGLWTIGSLFPELRRSSAWRERGRAILERLGQELIYEDGSFSQHSLNYHRVMLHDYLWAIRLGELHGRTFSQALYQRIAKAGDLLHQLQDEVTGRVPCYGANDGALVLPLDNCDYTDFRPVIQGARYLTTRARMYDDGPWDEDLLWLFGADATSARVNAPARRDLRADAGGYVTLRSKNGFAFTRCATFRHRPSHADMLHIDLWWRGHNIAVDPGTFSYNSPAPWDKGLSSTVNHNTVTVDGRDQMDKAGRFLWLPWARGKQTHDVTSETGYLSYWEGEHDGYQRLEHAVTHRRGILRIGDDHWLVLDDIRSEGPHDVRLHWLLADAQYAEEEGSDLAHRGQMKVSVPTPGGEYVVTVGCLTGQTRFSVVRADGDSTRGWRSKYYLERTPARSLAAEISGRTAQFWTIFGPGGYAVSSKDGAIVLSVSAGHNVRAEPNTRPGPLISSVTSRGAMIDQLEFAQ
jgi:asparagine synthase (glutamine-hydrolysing)